MNEAARDENRAKFVEMAMALSDDKQGALSRFLMSVISGNKCAAESLERGGREGFTLEQMLSSFSSKR